MSLPNMPDGLPPLPKGLRNALSVHNPSWRDTDKVHAIMTSIQEDLYAGREGPNRVHDRTLQGSMAQLRKDMVSLRQLDLSLLCQLLRLYENIQDWKVIMNGSTGHYDKTALHDLLENDAQQDYKEDNIYVNSPSHVTPQRPSFWHTRRSKTPDSDKRRSLVLQNPDFEESMLGPPAMPRNTSRSSRRNQSDRLNISGSSECRTPRSHSLDYDVSNMSWMHRSISMQEYPDQHSPPRAASTGSTGTPDSDDSLYLEPIACTHTEHKTVWQQHGRRYSSPHQKSSHKAHKHLKRQHSANSSFLYESTC